MNKRSFLFLNLFLCLLLFCQAVYSQDDMISLRIMTYNIQHGAGTDDVVDLDRQAAVINNATPDIVGLQEVDSCVKRSDRVPEAAILGTKTGMHATFGGAIPLTGGKYGVAILSKEIPISYHNTPLPGTEKRTMLVCEFEDYVFACTHLDLDEECRLNSLPIILEEASNWDKPFFICGDWNDSPSSTLIKDMKKSFRFLNYITDNKANYTFPASNPKKIIDYIACSPRVNAINSRKSSQVINEPEASDHRPVLVEVTLKSYATGIVSPLEEKEEENDVIYDLCGRKVSRTNLHGVFIQGGKKILK